MILATTIISTISIPVFAAPNSQTLTDTRAQYAAIEKKISDIEDQIYSLNQQIEPLQETVDKNKQEIASLTNVIDTTTKEIEQAKKEINDLDLALGQRLKAMYMNGDSEFSYLSFIFSSDSSSDFFSRIQAISKIVGKDKKAIDEITTKRNELNEKITSLEEKKKEINDLNKELQGTLSELDSKKSEQQTLAEEAKQERSKFDSEYLSEIEREVVQSQFSVIDNSNSTSSELESAVSQLKNLRDNQIKSPIITSEINEKIQKANPLITQKKAEEEEARKAAEAARRAEQAAAQREVSNSRGSSSSSNKTPSPSSQSSSSSYTNASGSVESVLNEAYNHLGKAYVWGATGPNTFDCSGLTQYVYRKAAGIDISRTTYSQINVGRPVSQSELQPGDLVFPHAGHVGIYVGNGNMIHAPQTGDVVKVSPVYKFYAARRILN